MTDRSHRGVVRITGPDRLSWLHSLTTQHLEHLGPGRTAEALILSPQGHIEHHLTLTDDGDALWAHVEPGTAGRCWPSWSRCASCSGSSRPTSPTTTRCSR